MAYVKGDLLSNSSMYQSPTIRTAGTEVLTSMVSSLDISDKRIENQDPTIAICRGLSETKLVGLSAITCPNMVIIPMSQNNIVGDQQSYQLLDQTKKQFDRINSNDFTRARNLANPYENVVSKFFMTRAATKLANIDWVFSLIPGDMKRFTPINPFRYVDLGAAPGSFSQYIQYRFPCNSLGYAFSLSPQNGGLPWDPKHLRLTHWINNPVTKRLDQIPLLILLPPPAELRSSDTGGIVTGDLTTEYQAMIRFINTKVNLIVSDAAFENGGDTLSLENGFIPLFAAQLLIISQTLLTGGNCCIKLFSSTTTTMLALLCIARTLFDQMYIFKPMSSRPGSDERYFVGIGRNNNNVPAILIQMLSTKQFIGFADDYSSNRFINEVIQLNINYVTQQINVLQNIAHNLKGVNSPQDSTNYEMALSIWNIPR